ncbi:MAG: hypothetical protein EBT81_10335 [Gammaproteobacteria bacterium]|nr:hypothetical protein [Gammaproteobacteria bacterium]
MIADCARALFETWLVENRKPRIRLLGVSTTEFVEEAQQDLFVDVERVQNEKLDATLDAIREKFGNAALGRASLLKRER